MGNCAKCREYRVLDRHHVRTKGRGGDKLIGLCRKCHRWVGDNPDEAAKLGLYIKGYGEVQSAQGGSDTEGGGAS